MIMTTAMVTSSTRQASRRRNNGSAPASRTPGRRTRRRSQDPRRRRTHHQTLSGPWAGGDRAEQHHGVQVRRAGRARSAPARVRQHGGRPAAAASGAAARSSSRSPMTATAQREHAVADEEGRYAGPRVGLSRANGSPGSMTIPDPGSPPRRSMISSRSEVVATRRTTRRSVELRHVRPVGVVHHGRDAFCASMAHDQRIRRPEQTRAARHSSTQADAYRRRPGKVEGHGLPARGIRYDRGLLAATWWSSVDSLRGRRM